MRKIDELTQRQLQVLLSAVARLAHRSYLETKKTAFLGSGFRNGTEWRLSLC